MILMRPLLRANAARLHNAHVVVFFIFLVANIGGALTPLGNPPLFVGFLHGVDFFWTTRHLLGADRARGRAWCSPSSSSSTSGSTAGIAASRRSARARRRSRLRVRGRDQLPADRRHRGGDPAVRDCGSRACTFEVYGTTLELQNLVRDAALILIAVAVARAHAQRAPRGQRLHLGADRGGGDPVRRHLRLHHSGAGDAAGRPRRARSPGSSPPPRRTTAARTTSPISGSPARSRPFSTMRRPIWCSSSSPAATPAP